MKTKYSYKQIWTITFPILISLIMEQMIGMTDTAFLGRVGEIELGASAIAGVYYLAIFMMAFGFSIGAQTLEISEPVTSYPALLSRRVNAPVPQPHSKILAPFGKSVGSSDII